MTVKKYTSGSILKQPFGALLLKYRKKSKITVKDLAKRAKLSTLAVLKIENGTRMPTTKSVEALIESLGLPPHKTAALEESAKKISKACDIIVRERKSRGLSIREVAKVVGISHGALQKIENGAIRPTINTALRIAEALKLSDETWRQVLSHFFGNSSNGTLEEYTVLTIMHQAGIDAEIVKVNNSQRIRFCLNPTTEVYLTVEAASNIEPSTDTSKQITNNDRYIKRYKIQ